MKLKTPTKLIIAALVIALEAVLFSPSAEAQTPLTYTADDLLLGFRATGDPGSTQDYLLDLGQASIYVNATDPITLNTGLAAHGGINIGNIGADLVSLFGASWFTRGDLFWGVAGAVGAITPVGSDPIKTLYASIAESPAGTAATPWSRGSASAQGAVSSRLQSEGAVYAMTGSTQNMSTANSPVGLIQSASTTSSYSFYESGTQSYLYFNTPTTEGAFANGASGAVLDLIRLAPGTGAGTEVGTFSITSGGALTFTPAIPEPTSLALLTGLAGGFLGTARLRRTGAAPR